MTTEELERLKALCDAATPGPWIAASKAIVCHVETVLFDEELRCRDKNFIVASREAMPALIAEMEQLQKRVAWLEEQVHQKPWLCARLVIRVDFQRNGTCAKCRSRKECVTCAMLSRI